MTHLITRAELEPDRHDENADELLRELRKLLSELPEHERTQVREVIASAIYVGRYSC